MAVLIRVTSVLSSLAEQARPAAFPASDWVWKLATAPDLHGIYQVVPNAGANVALRARLLGARGIHGRGATFVIL
jgi:hypothetical protein